jgi:hypothetical protein
MVTIRERSVDASEQSISFIPVGGPAVIRVGVLPTIARIQCFPFIPVGGPAVIRDGVLLNMYFVPLLTLLVCLIRASGTRDATAVDPASAASSSGESFATGVFASASLRRWPPEFHDGDPTRPPGRALAGERGGEGCGQRLGPG